jgi:hypothetical protein
MSATSSAPQPTSSDILGEGGAAQKSANQSIKTFAASLSTAAVIFGVQMALFLIFSGNWKIKRSTKEAVKSGKPETQQESLWRKI